MLVYCKVDDGLTFNTLRKSRNAFALVISIVFASLVTHRKKRDHAALSSGVCVYQRVVALGNLLQ